MLRAPKMISRMGPTGPAKNRFEPISPAGFGWTPLPGGKQGGLARLLEPVRRPGILAATLVAASLCLGPARADENAPKASPRAAVEIGGASVVLLSANDKIYAFVDRLEDNAPVTDSALSVDLADGSTLALSRVTDGLYVAPFNRAGHMQDAFMISLVSPDGTGDGAAEIAYDDQPPPERPGIVFDRHYATLAAGAAAVGAVVAGLGIFLSRIRRRRRAAAPIVSALARS
jgi:hypothetical protein